MTAGEIRRAAGCRRALPAGDGAGGCGNGALPCRAVLQYCRGRCGRLIVCNQFMEKNKKHDNATDEKSFFSRFKLGVIRKTRIYWPGSGRALAGVSVGQSVAGRSPGRRQGAAGASSGGRWGVGRGVGWWVVGWGCCGVSVGGVGCWVGGWLSVVGRLSKWRFGVGRSSAGCRRGGAGGAGGVGGCGAGFRSGFVESRG